MVDVIKVQLYVQYMYVIFPYVDRTLTSIYDENKLCVSYLQTKFTKFSTVFVLDSHKCKQQKQLVGAS